ncbi:MAG: rod shape-determining protein MreC [Acidobacteriota bacterium]
MLEAVRGGSSGFLDDYLLLIDVRQENKRLHTELDTARLDVQRMRADLETADRAQALALFQKESQMKTVPARVIMNSPGGNGGANSSVFVDVGSSQGIQRGMAVITPSGIVGKVTAVYPIASMVLLMNDPLFAAGVISQKNHVQGTLKGQGNSPAIVDFVQNEQTVEPGEMFFTSGNDFIFSARRPCGHGGGGEERAAPQRNSDQAERLRSGRWTSADCHQRGACADSRGGSGSGPR